MTENPEEQEIEVIATITVKYKATVSDYHQAATMTNAEAAAYDAESWSQGIVNPAEILDWAYQIDVKFEGAP